MRRLAAAVAAAVVLAGCSSTATTPGGSGGFAGGAEVTVPPTTLVAGSCHAVGKLPDPVCTPGVANPKVTQANVGATICKAGWTKTIRPPVAYTNRLKQIQMAAYGFTGPPSRYEEDHLISLELGGDPADPRNLWPEPGRSPNEKDLVENRLRAEVCSGGRTLVDAQRRIAWDWTTAA